MGDTFEIVYDSRVIKEDLVRLDRRTLVQIKNAIESKLISSPELYGKPLRGPLHGYWSLRVGDYRIAYHIKKRVVYVDVIDHRETVYGALSDRSDN